jgi:hypothetical protein
MVGEHLPSAAPKSRNNIPRPSSDYMQRETKGTKNEMKGPYVN